MEIKVYIKNSRTGVNAKAVYNTETKACVVKKGSIVSVEVSNSPKFRGTKTILEKRAESVSDRTVKRDTEFKSASTAANFVTGSSTNGLMAWKDESGIKLKDLL